MSEHFTLRMRDGTRGRLKRSAERTGTTPRTLAQRYIDEGLRHSEHPMVHFVDGPSGRRAALIGTGLDIWEVIATVRDNDGNAEEAASYLDIPQGLVEAAVAYYGQYRNEVDAEIAANEAAWEDGYAAWQAGQEALSA